eukprot:6212349-Prymnesium_polylepis.1
MKVHTKGGASARVGRVRGEGGSTFSCVSPLSARPPGSQRTDQHHVLQCTQTNGPGVLESADRSLHLSRYCRSSRLFLF